MKTPPFFFLRPIFRAAQRLVLWRASNPAMSEPPTADTAESYRGLFHGVIENAPPFPQQNRTRLQGARAGIIGQSGANASGFVHIQVDQQKKATGSFMFFADGQVLTGAVEGTAESQGRFVEASFRLDADCAQHSAPGQRAPIVAVGRMEMETGHSQKKADPGKAASAGDDELTIRFV